MKKQTFGKIQQTRYASVLKPTPEDVETRTRCQFLAQLSLTLWKHNGKPLYCLTVEDDFPDFEVISSVSNYVACR